MSLGVNRMLFHKLVNHKLVKFKINYPKKIIQIG